MKKARYIFSVDYTKEKISSLFICNFIAGKILRVYLKRRRDHYRL